jgi:hypothetical protein
MTIRLPSRGLSLHPLSANLKLYETSNNKNMHEAKDKNVKNAAILPTDASLLVNIYDNATKKKR